MSPSKQMADEEDRQYVSGLEQRVIDLAKAGEKLLAEIERLTREAKYHQARADELRDRDTELNRLYESASDDNDRLRAERDSALAHCNLLTTEVARLERQLIAEQDHNEQLLSQVVPIPVNLPFERVPQHASDPGFGAVPPEPDFCPHGVRKEFRAKCAPCNEPAPPDETPACICRVGDGPQEDCPVHGRASGKTDGGI
jgi:predicted  nucleic acid-binding Zn-ribbon protein